MAGNQTLVELGCWVVREASRRPFFLAWCQTLANWPQVDSVSVGEKGRLRKGKQNRPGHQGSIWIRTHDPQPSVFCSWVQTPLTD